MAALGTAPLDVDKKSEGSKETMRVVAEGVGADDADVRIVMKEDGVDETPLSELLEIDSA